MSKTRDVGVYQLDNGNWGYRYGVVVNGRTVWKKKSKDDTGSPFRTKMAAVRARNLSLAQVQNGQNPKKIVHKTVAEIYKEYCEYGRTGRAYATIKKQDSLWNNHLKSKFGSRLITEISVAEIQDYLAKLYYTEGRAYSYVESFLKMFYLIYGQAYSRDYITAELYDRMCKNKDTKIHMPKMKIDEETDIVVFSKEELEVLDEYFKGTNAELSYLLGKYCGLRINECYGIKWSNIDFDNGTILIDRQMQYQEGLIKLVSVKTRNAKREVYMSSELKDYLWKCQKEIANLSETMILQREQNQTKIQDIDGNYISSLELINSCLNGKIQTNNSMKYHTRKIGRERKICFRYHYLRHTYGTMLATMNTPIHILCNQMGHASSRVTQEYYIGKSQTGINVLKRNLELF